MVQLTDLAAINLGQMMKRKCCALGVQISITTYGCNGKAYEVKAVYEAKNEWTVYDCKGIKIFVDPNDLPYIENLTLDWVKEGLSSKLEFINPNEVSRCGCGKSFQIDPNK